MLDDLELSQEERRVAGELHDRGYAVIDFPDDQLEERIERIKRSLAPRFDVDMAAPETVKNSGQVLRVQDAWAFDTDVRAIASNNYILELLGKLYGRRAFPFQTLNFPVGTQQHLHSDSIHFSSLPERFMCGVWVAMEDVHADAGPLTYLPGSHKWPILSNLMIGRRGFGSPPHHAQDPFEPAWDALVETSGLKRELFLAKKGQALIWAANLLHGGSVQADPTRTRWSQVTHYYFEDCIYYTPAFSDEALGQLDLRTITNVATGEIEPNTVLGAELLPLTPKPSRAGKAWRWLRRSSDASSASLPQDFDSSLYLRLNPDVAAAGADPAEHFVRHGAQEGRPYRAG
jgi:hypothetical protein